MYKTSTIVFSLAIGIGLFFFLPLFVADFSGATQDALQFNLLAGAVRLTIFLLYLWAMSRWSEIKRVFEYHGAEHKSIFAQEAGLIIPGEEGAARAIRNGIAIPDPAPDRTRGEGPFKQLLVTNVMLISGEGAPPRGPMTIIIEGDRIAAIQASEPSFPGAQVIDGTGMYALPGFIDAHTHIGNTGQGLTGDITPPEYVFKLWLAHGITTVREVGSGMGLDWTVHHRERSERGEISAPRIIAHTMFPGGSITSAESAEAWVREVHRRGVHGVHCPLPCQRVLKGCDGARERILSERSSPPPFQSRVRLYFVGGKTRPS